MMVDWQRLAEIKELQDYFATDFEGFQRQIENRIAGLQKIDSEEFDKLALLRVLEVTNGCLQWSFRRQDAQCLSVEQTRECMRQVIGFIQNKKIELPDGEEIQFAPNSEALMEESRELYQAAFKKNIAEKEREYFAYSTAQFIVYGRQRLQAAMERVEQEFESLFTPYFIERGRRYISPYIEALEPES